MARKEIDLVDVVPLIVVPVFAGIALGVFSFDITIFSEFSFSDALWSGEDLAVTWAEAITVAGVAMIVATNEIDGSDYESWEYGVIIFALAIVPLNMLVPQIETWLTDHDSLALMATFAVSAASVFIAYIE